MNSIFCATIDAKDGDTMTLCYFACNLLARIMPGGRPFCIMDFIWNELRRTMNDPKKLLPSAPYIMYMIERVTKITFPKDCKHAFMLILVIHHVRLDLIPLHLFQEPLPLSMGTMIPSSKGCSKAFSACARL
jgi:hypothetical protein